jgi:polyphosphate kinase
MTTGALIFAHNNEHTDYVSMARWSARNIERHLDIPVHIVTEKDNSDGNARWFDDYQSHVEWHNQSRVTAYDISPWDRTLLLDADYVVASDQLKTILDAPQDFLCHR